MDHTSSIDGLIFEFFHGARSLGAERGTDLLLLLAYLRWRLRDDRTAWDRLPDATASDEQLDVLGHLVADLVPASGREVPLGAFVEDGGKALHWIASAMTRWGADSQGFEAVLRIRRKELSKASVDHETANEVAQLMVACLPGQPERVLDPACGIGTCLLAAHHAGARELHGIELNAWTAAVARMRLEMAGAPALIVTDDALSLAPWPQADAVLLDPPWSLRLDASTRSLLTAEHEDLIVPPNGDLVWAQFAHRSISPAGRAVVLLPVGAGWRRNVEREARRQILERGGLEAYIALARPKRSTQVAGAVWLMQSATTAARSPVLIADAPALPSTVDADEHQPWASEVVDALRDFRSGQEIAIAAHVARVVHWHTLLEETQPRSLLEPPPELTIERPVPSRRLLTELRLENLKAFGGAQSVHLAPITLLYGQNSAGKSSVLQSLLLLKQSIDAGTLVTQGQYTDAGSFLSLLHRHDAKRDLRLGITFGAIDRWLNAEVVPDPSQLRSVDLTFSSPAEDLPIQREARLGIGSHKLDFRRVDGADSATFDVGIGDIADVFAALAGYELLWREKDASRQPETAERLRSRQGNARRALRLLGEALGAELSFDAYGLLPGDIEAPELALVDHHAKGADNREAGIARSYATRFMQLAAGIGTEARTLLDDLGYLRPLRSAPQRFYDRAAATAGIGTPGERVALYLWDNRSEIEGVDSWLSRLGVPYELDVVPVRAGRAAVLGDLVALVLRDQRLGGLEVSPLDVGFGVSQVLPIVVELLASQERVILIEQPEIHLHPKLQTELGDLLIHATSETANANQVIVETHSEHLLLRLQRRIREGLIPAEHVAVQYVEAATGDHDGAQIRRLRLDDQGFFLDPWPGGFFDESLDELFGGGG
jgi:predicted ATPase